MVSGDSVLLLRASMNACVPLYIPRTSFPEPITPPKECSMFNARRVLFPCQRLFTGAYALYHQGTTNGRECKLHSLA